MKSLTLAIPAYNMGHLISRCLDSVLQKELCDDVEILLINDGSKDNTLDIMRRYEHEWPETIRVIDKPNGGWGSAINLAMKEASGKYFKILDSDDWFQKDAFRSFVKILGASDEDLIATSFSKVYDEHAPQHIEFAYQEGSIHQLDALLKEHGFNSFLPMATLCFKASLLRDISLNDRYYGDVEYSVYPLSKVKEVKFYNINLYQYYLVGNEHSTSQLGYKRHFMDFIEMTFRLLKFYNRGNFAESYKRFLQNDISKQVRFTYYLLMSPAFIGGTENYKKLLNEHNQRLRESSDFFYKRASSATIKGLIPFISIWRIFGINILNWRK